MNPFNDTGRELLKLSGLVSILDKVTFAQLEEPTEEMTDAIHHLVTVISDLVLEIQNLHDREETAHTRAPRAGRKGAAA